MRCYSRGDEYSTNNKKEEGHILHRNCPLKDVIEGKVVGKIEVTGR